MVDHTAFMEQNAERILAVQALFGAAGRPLAQSGRVLVGEGHLLKLCRRRPQPKAFFLFDDILVYGRVVLLGRWYAGQQVVPLEDLALEDVEDGLDMKNQWLIRTPRKSFYVSAASPAEKRAWMEHIGECRAERLRRTVRPPKDSYAAVWIPDCASAICMRCCAHFSATQRRHHCRRCGFLVCASCSRDRFLLPDLSARPVRVCRLCHWALWTQHPTAQAGTRDGEGKDEGEPATPVYEPSSDEERDEEGCDHPAPSQPAAARNHIRKSSWSPYVNLKNYLRAADLGKF